MSCSFFLFFNSDEVTRNYLPQSKEEPLIRDCCLLPWFPDKLTDKEWLAQLSSEFTLEYTIKQLSDVQMKVCIYFSVKTDCNLKKRGQLLSLTAVLSENVQNLVMLCFDFLQSFDIFVLEL